MDPRIDQSRARAAWRLAERQHWVLSRGQLLELGMGADAIKHRLKNGRLHPTRWRGVYAVGRRELDRLGTWMAALLAAGEGAVLSHWSATRLWELLVTGRELIEISVPAHRRPRLRWVRIHRRANLADTSVTVHHGILVTTPIQTIIDIAPSSTRAALDRIVNEADKRGLVDPETLRSALDHHVGEPGVAIVRELLDRRTFTLADSELERRFVPLALEAGLPLPETQAQVNGCRVDFFWPELGIVVETDGLRYHRTPEQQSFDRRRDQIHTAAGLTPLRFTHAQVAFEPKHIVATLRRVAERLARSR